MARFEEVGVRATVQNFGKFMAELTAMRSAIGGLGGIGKTAAGGLGLVSGALTAVAAGAAAVIAGIGAVVTGLAVIGVAGVRTAASFESAFAGILKTTEGLGTTLFSLTGLGEKVFQEFRNLALRIPLPFEELARIGEIAGQLGIAETALAGFTEVVAGLGVATELAVEDAAFVLSRFVSVFQVAEQDIVDIASRIGSTIVGLGNNFAATEPQITDFANNLLGIGKVVGLTPDEILGISTAFVSVGAKAEAGGTAVQRILLDIQKAVLGGAGTIDEAWQGVLRSIVVNTDKSLSEVVDIFIEGGDELERLAKKAGVSVDDVGKAISLGLGEQGSEKLQLFAQIAGLTAEEFINAWETNPAEAFTRFVEGLGAAGEEGILLLEELDLDTQRLLRSLLPVAGAGDRMREALELAGIAFENNSDLTTEAEKRYATFESKLQLFKNTVKDVGLEIGLVLIPPLTDLFEALVPLIPIIGDALIPIFEGFATVITNVAEAISGISTGGIGSIFDGFTGVVTPDITVDEDAIAQIGGFLSADDVLTLPEIDADGAISEADRLKAAIAELRAAIEEDAPAIQSIFENAFLGMAETAANSNSQIAQNSAGIIESITRLFDGLGRIAALVFGFGLEIAFALGNGLVLGITGVIAGFFQIITGDFQGAKITLVNTAKEIVNGILAVFNTDLAQLSAIVKEKLQESQNAAAGFINRFFKTGADIAAGLVNGILSKLQDVRDAIAKLLGAAEGTFRDQSQTRSPSRVYEGFGRNLDEGLALGIIKSQMLVEKAIGAVTGRIVNSGAVAVNNITNAGGTTNNSFAPTVNANYSQTQAPVGIMDDLQLLEILRTAGGVG
jgi:hypothetical protein